MVFYDYAAEKHRTCDHDGCEEEGLHRAPKSRQNLQEYHWFCLSHVRDYNKRWNYCAGMDEEQIEDEIRRSTTWDRPTWPSHLWAKMEEKLARAAWQGAGFAGYGGDTGDGHRAPPPTTEGKALAALGLADGVDFKTIKTRYRSLVKQHHPDLHGGDPEAEERLKKINQAFHTLKRAHEPDKVH